MVWFRLGAGLWRNATRGLLVVGMLAPSLALAAGLTLDEAQRQALLGNADLKAQRAAVEAARGRLQQAGLWPNPRLVFSNASFKPVTTKGDYSRSVAISQDIAIAGRFDRGKDAARIEIALALAELNDAERKLLGQVETAYYTIAVIEPRVALQDRLIGVDESLARTAGSRQKAGEVSVLDVNTATLELERARHERSLLLGERQAKLAEFAGLLGLPIEQNADLDTKLPPIAPPSSLPTLVSDALNRRPDLRLAALSADRARAEQLLAKASAWEDWTVSLGFQQSRADITGAPTQPRSDAFLLSLTVPLPFINRNEGSIAAARATETGAVAQLTALKLEIQHEVEGGYQELVGLAAALRNLRERTLPLSQNNAATARAAYLQGRIPISDVVQIERQDVDINTSYLDTLGRYFQSLSELDTRAFAAAGLATHPVELSADSASAGN